MSDQLQFMQGLGGEELAESLGYLAPVSQAGAHTLAYAATRRAADAGRVGTRYLNAMPLASTGLSQQYGMAGAMAEMAGNVYLGQAFKSYGRLAMGDNTNVATAMQSQAYMKSQAEVMQSVSALDSESYYRSFRGLAAMTGQPFDAAQRKAAKSLADSVASMGQYAAIIAPDLIDSLAGEKGSAAVMATNMMDFNRYRVDPTTGRLGYSAKTNTAMVESLFNTMFSDENMPAMRGIRAGDVGEMYRTLGHQGLLGPRESMRERTLSALSELRNQGQDLTTLAKSVGLDKPVGEDLAELTDAELSKFREATSVQSKVTSVDTKGIAGRLQGYTDSLSALREIFGENGNPNAPIPMLIGALQELTSGQMQKFDAGRLNHMVRDLQAISQISGKSIDQLTAMNQSAALSGQRLGIGTTFSPEATRAGALTGMAFQESGGAVGFGAINRTEAESQAIERFNLGVSSEFGNAVGVLGRIQNSGGFSDNVAGQRLKNILSAVESGDTTYEDPTTGEQVAIPVHESQYRQLISAGGVDGMGLNEFNIMLSQRTSNLRNLHDNPNRQKAAFNMQSTEIGNEISRAVVSTMEASLSDQIEDPRKRAAASSAIGKAASGALLKLSPEQMQSKESRQSIVGQAIREAADKQGVVLTDENIRLMAEQSFGTAETRANNFGYDSLTAFAQVQGEQVTRSRNTASLQTDARRDLNVALQGLNTQGGLMRRAMIALQRAGDDGESANLVSFFADAVGAPAAADIQEKITPLLQAATKKEQEIQQQIALLSETKDPAEQKKIRGKITRLTEELQQDISTKVMPTAKELGIGGSDTSFDREDVGRSALAYRQLRHDAGFQTAVQLAEITPISQEDRVKFHASKLTTEDVTAMAEHARSLDLAKVDKRMGDIELEGNEELKQRVTEKQEKGLTEAAAREQVAEELRAEINAKDYETEQKAIAEKQHGRDLTVGFQDAVIRSRRQQVTDVTREDVKTQIDLLRQSETPDEREARESRQAKLTELKTEYGRLESIAADNTQPAESVQIAKTEMARLSPEISEVRKEVFAASLKESREAEDMLRTEQRLRTAGLLGSEEKLTGELENVDPELRKRIIGTDSPLEREKIAAKYMHEQAQKNLIENYPAAKEKAIAFVRSQEGRDAVERAEESFTTLSDLRSDFLLDPEAAKRAGVGGLVAVQQSREAEEEIRAASDRYAGGNLARFLTLGALGTTVDGERQLQADFESLDDEGRSRLLTRLQANDPDRYASRDVASLTVADARADLQLSLEKNLKTMSDAKEGMLSEQPAGLSRLLNEDLSSLGLSPEQQQQIEKHKSQLSGYSEKQLDALTTLDDLQQGVEARAAVAGVTTEEYLNYMQTAEEPADAIAGRVAGMQRMEPEREATANANVEKAAELEKRKKALTAGLADAKPGEKERLEESLAALEPKLTAANAAVEEDMAAAGYTDRGQFVSDLQRRESIAAMQSDRSRYQEALGELPATDAATVTEQIKVKREVEQGITGILQTEADKELLSASSRLVTAAGFDGEDAAAIESMQVTAGSNLEANLRTVASAVSGVGQKKYADESKVFGSNGLSGLQKLDTISDAWAASETTAEKEAVAKKFGYSYDQLDSLMRRTSALGLSEIDASKGELTGQTLRERLQGVNVNLEKEAKSEEDRTLKLTGSLEITGTVNGQATARNLTGVSAR